MDKGAQLLKKCTKKWYIIFHLPDSQFLKNVFVPHVGDNVALIYTVGKSLISAMFLEGQY